MKRRVKSAKRLHRVATTVKSNLLEVRLSSRQLFKNLFRRFAENCEVAVVGAAGVSAFIFRIILRRTNERDCGLQ